MKKKLCSVLLCVLLCLTPLTAFAENLVEGEGAARGRVLTTVPSSHTVTVSYNDGGFILATGQLLTGGGYVSPVSEAFVGDLVGAGFEAAPGGGYTASVPRHSYLRFDVIEKLAYYLKAYKVLDAGGGDVTEAMREAGELSFEYGQLTFAQVSADLNIVFEFEKCADADPDPRAHLALDGHVFRGDWETKLPNAEMEFDLGREDETVTAADEHGVYRLEEIKDGFHLVDISAPDGSAAAQAAFAIAVSETAEGTSVETLPNGVRLVTVPESAGSVRLDFIVRDLDGDGEDDDVEIVPAKDVGFAMEGYVYAEDPETHGLSKLPGADMSFDAGTPDGQSATVNPGGLYRLDEIADGFHTLEITGPDGSPGERADFSVTVDAEAERVSVEKLPDGFQQVVVPKGLELLRLDFVVHPMVNPDDPDDPANPDYPIEITPTPDTVFGMKGGVYIGSLTEHEKFPDAGMDFDDGGIQTRTNRDGGYKVDEITDGFHSVAITGPDGRLAGGEDFCIAVDKNAGKLTVVRLPDGSQLVTVPAGTKTLELDFLVDPLINPDDPDDPANPDFPVTIVPTPEEIVEPPPIVKTGELLARHPAIAGFVFLSTAGFLFLFLIFRRKKKEKEEEEEQSRPANA